jgi:cytochrome c556
MVGRVVLAIAMLAAGHAAAIAQDVIAERKALMKRSSEQITIGAAMTKGEQPFDLEKAQAIFRDFAEKAAKLPGLFPANSKIGDTRALSDIWNEPQEWKAAIEKFAADVKAAQTATKDAQSFKMAFAKVGKNCVECHEEFRKRQR